MNSTDKCAGQAAPSHGSVRVIEQEARNLQSHIWGLERELRDVDDRRQNVLNENLLLQSRDAMHQGVIKRMALEIERLRREPVSDNTAAVSFSAVSNQLREPWADRQIKSWSPDCRANEAVREILELQRKAAKYDEAVAFWGLK